VQLINSKLRVLTVCGVFVAVEQVLDLVYESCHDCGLMC
jgi:hypothetical protein